ncbi:MAG: glutamate 5-kinase [Actinobacteria bacterium]|nr:glutamate 5-kinase [Actinomycetota bacterium]
MDRKKYLKNIKRVVIKIGSSSLTLKSGGLDIANMKKFTGEVRNVTKKGIEIIIVTSGAIAAGLKYLNILKRPNDISILQAAASVGQVELMKAYDNLFSEYSLKVGQILLTKEDTTRRKQYLNIRNTIENLIKLNVIPIINENDSSAVDEIKFGDNDNLAALVSSLAEADALIILSDIDGMYDKNPKTASDAKLIPFVEKVTLDIEKIAGGIGSTFGSGGMVTKIKAAKICSFSGIAMIIANSRMPDVLDKILNFESIGTFFVPQTIKKVKSIKRWIAFGMRTKGSIIIDRGAEDAIKNKGKSILAIGVVKILGDFNKGDTLKVLSVDNKLIAKGISSFSAEEIDNIKGKNQNQIAKQFSSSFCSEIINRDCLVVFDG